jgi:hypothetical protein
MLQAGGMLRNGNQAFSDGALLTHHPPAPANVFTAEYLNLYKISLLITPDFLPGLYSISHKHTKLLPYPTRFGRSSTIFRDNL